MLNFASMNIFKRILIWIQRMPHSRGFGVQSPSAYRFIRYVVNEHYPYYAYIDLKRKYTHIDWLTRKRMEFYFRLANFCQSDTFLNFASDDATMRVLIDYVWHGCKKTIVKLAKMPIHDDDCRLLRICPQDGCCEFLQVALEKSNSKSVFVIEDIATNDMAKKMWQTLVESEKVSVSYDMYYLGVAFFDIERFKANYIVNF